MSESGEREEDCETKAGGHGDPADDPAQRSCRNPSKNTWRERRFRQDHLQDRPRRIVVVILGVISEILRGDPARNPAKKLLRVSYGPKVK